MDRILCKRKTVEKRKDLIFMSTLETMEKKEEIKIFNNEQFGQIRTVVIDGEPWFSGLDVATALGMKTQRTH